MTNGREKSVTGWRRRAPILVLGALVLALLTLLVLLQSTKLWQYFPVDTASDTLTLYALSSLNFFALVIFAFIFLRSVVKLARERRRASLGARLKTRLLIYFVAVSLLPIAAMATFSYLFLNRALERWFSRLPETVIVEARDVQRRAVAERIAAFEDKIRLVAALVETKNQFDEADLRQILERGDLSAIEIAAPNNVVLARVSRETSDGQNRLVRETLTQLENSNANELKDGIGFDAASVRLVDGRNIRIVSGWQPDFNINREIINSRGEFENLKQQQIAARGVGFWTLSLLTFLLIFAATWIAFHLGRSLTQPIKALAEASKEIAGGNLAYRVEVLAEDELALLVGAFNQMASELQENQRNLEERRRYIETVLQSLTTGVVSLDEQNRVTTINRAAVTMLRLNDQTVENRLLGEVLTTDDIAVLEKLAARARRLGRASEQTVLFRQPATENGSGGENRELPVALAATALRDSYNKTFGVVLVIEDLSELLAAQRAAAWQEVARRMAHEIKNPLTPIQLAAERIAKNFNRSLSLVPSPLSATSNGLAGTDELAEQTKDKGQGTNDKAQLTKVVGESTDTILREVSSLKAMVDEFAQFARLPNAKLEPDDLNEIVRQTAALYEDRLGGAQIEVELQKDLPPAMIDREQMRRALVNLIDNALEAFDIDQKEKRITIKTEFDAARDLLLMEIADNGRGIAAGNFAKIFQPYFSTKGRGTGLGLAIVQRIVAEHGGKIRAVVNHPQGAKFVVELPCQI